MFASIMSPCSRPKFSRVIIHGPLSEPGDAREDLVGRLCPDERLGSGVMRVNEGANRGLEFRGCDARRSGRACSGVSANPRATRFSQEPYVGVKWT